jgi:hypothetical protein
MSPLRLSITSNNGAGNINKGNKVSTHGRNYGYCISSIGTNYGYCGCIKYMHHTLRANLLSTNNDSLSVVQATYIEGQFAHYKQCQSVCHQ